MTVLTPYTPIPIGQFIVCSACRLPWEKHPKEPTPMDCIRLLRAELDQASGITPREEAT